MINEKDILAMLQNGESADDIAQKLVDVLNKGKNLYDEELAAKAKANEEAENKIKDMKVIIDLVHDFVLEYYCESEEDINKLEEIFATFTPEEAIKQIEEAGALALEINKMIDKMNLCFPLETPTKKPKCEFKVNSKADADFVINSFLKSIGL